MPKRIFSLINTRRVQTIPNVLFRENKMGPNPGPYPNPLIGWREQLDCSSCHNISTVEIIKNNCCTPVIERIQNKNGVIDTSYNYTTKGYLQRRCLTYKQNAFNFDISNNTLHPFCCGDHCHPPRVSVYKRNNQQFRKQGAVSSRTRLNRLKYNAIVSSLPKGEIYWGGQTAYKSILRNKTKNKCFCGGRNIAPCDGRKGRSCPPN